MNAIHIIITGGAIDKSPSFDGKELVFTNSVIEDALSLCRITYPIVYHNLMLKDSLTMTTGDRLSISGRCTSIDSNKIIITHGTDTMTQTAEFLSLVRDKTIILVGSIVPLRVDLAEGMFNLGVAMTAVQYLPHGVYIAMNGKIFNYTDVEKNKINGLFEGNSYIM
jgi:L-asparaginase